MKKVVAIHLLNDYSGSPLILATVLKGFRENNIPVDLCTSKEGSGFLSNLDVNYQPLSYQWHPNKYRRLLNFLVFQVILFFKLLSYRKEDVVIYINTLLPFGAALAGKLMGKRVVYHFHETSIKPALLKRFLKMVANKTAQEIIYVSKFLHEKEGLKQVKARIVPNSLSPTFLADASKYLGKAKDPQIRFVVLMLCSLKEYKGVLEFLQIARAMRDIEFELVLNANEAAIEEFFEGYEKSDNLTIFPVQTNVHLFYKHANLVLNLSRPDEWVETFGMTLLEAMHYSIPAIAPPVGGPAELIEDGVNGYQIDARQWELVVDKINTLLKNPTLYQQLCQNAKAKASLYTHKNMIKQVLEVVS